MSTRGVIGKCATRRDSAAAARRRRAARSRPQLARRARASTMADQVAVVRAAAPAHDQEGVERVAVARRVDLRVEDVEAGAVEVAADAREQVLLVGRVDQHLQAFADRREARLARPARRCRRGSAGGACARRSPARRGAGSSRCRAASHSGPCASSGSAYRRSSRSASACLRASSCGVARRAARRRARAAWRGTGPRAACPSRRSTPSGWCRGCRPRSAGRARSGGARCRPASANARDHVRVATGPASARRATSSGGSRPGTRPARRPRAARPCCAAEAARVARAERASGRRRGPWRCRGTARRRRAASGARSRSISCEQNGYSCAMLRHGEAAQVAHHHQDVLVDRVDVEQVVLHLADDAAEHRQVAAEDAVLVHAAQLVHDAARLLQDAAGRARGCARVVAERGVDQRRARATARAACAPSCPCSSVVLHQQQEGLEDRERLALEQVARRAISSSSPRTLEALVERRGAAPAAGSRRASRFCSRIVLSCVTRLGGPVVALHQRFARARDRGVSRVAELRGERGLQVEHQAVLAPAGEVVQADAQVLQQRFVARELRAPRRA